MSTLSVAELRQELRRLQVPDAALASCIERPDFERLYAEAKRAAEAKSVPQAHVPKAAPQAATAVPETEGSGLPFGLTWQNALFLGLVAYWVISSLGISIGGATSKEPDVLASAGESAVLQGLVVELQTHSDYESTLALHRDQTGLPVVVDFYSNGCGPCRMIAPTFKQLASEYQGRIAFTKVNVNRNYETSQTCGVRAMPTFQFYVGGRLVHSFSGADAGQLRRTAAGLAEKAEGVGTFAGKEVTEGALRSFYEKHDQAKLAEVPKLYTQYREATAKLIKLLKRKYGEAPTVSQRPLPEEEGGDGDGADGSGGKGPEGKGVGALEAALGSASVDDLRAELKKREEHADGGSGPPPTQLDNEPPTTSAQSPARVVVIGGGPAGLSAALYAARAGLSPVVIAPAEGGQLLGKGVEVENFPGSVAASGEPHTGPAIVEVMRRQASAFNASLVADTAVSVDLSGRPYKLKLNASAATVFASAVIIATGADARWLGVEGEYAYRGVGVSSCATCDGFLYRGQHVLVVGGGDAAMEDALVLARTSASVTIVHRRDAFRASHILARRVLDHGSIRVRWSTTVDSFGGEAGRGLTHVMLRRDGATQAERVDVGAAFVAIGHEPNTDLFRGQIDTTPGGYLDMSQSGRSARTSKPGVFACGDVADPTYRQAITSAASGAMAALDAERWLSEEGA